jgi:hypothetical protein
MTYWHRFTLLPFSILWFALGAPAAEDACQDTSTIKHAAQSYPGGDLKLSRFPAVLGHNLTANLFTRGNLLPFLIGSAASLAIAPADQEASRSMYNHAHKLGDMGEIAGPIITGSIAGGAFLASRLTKNEHLRAFGFTLMQAYVTNAILMQGIKYSTNRMRPDGSAANSFPSGLQCLCGCHRSNKLLRQKVGDPVVCLLRISWSFAHRKETTLAERRSRRCSAWISLWQDRPPWHKTGYFAAKECQTDNNAHF